MPFGLGARPKDFARYRVNVVVDNAGTTGAPIVVEHNPTYYNVIGRVEYRGSFGTMVTDFREIKAGALHRANGGYLVLDTIDVLRHPFTWEALKRALRSAETRIENLGEEFSAVPIATLRPEPIPLEVKVVLLGTPYVHQALYQLDEDFRELFKVKADFAPELDWTREHHENYAAFVSRWVRENGLRHLDRAAVAKLIEHGARLREHQKKLSARLIEISDVVSEASFWAEKLGHPLVEAGDVELALRKKEYRSSLIEERVRELVRDGTLVIATEGERVGQVNGLAILDLGDHSFGRPSRVSARVSLGRGGIESIEREIELSGPIHSKGFMILSSYIAATYAQEWPLAASATLTFEQGYDEVEGDSASSTELYALLSALSGLPLAQGIAVTGSVDQNGNVQAVGGVTRKIEGFYATCKVHGLTGGAGRDRPGGERQEPDARRGDRRGGPRGHVPRVGSANDRRGHRAAHRPARGQAPCRRLVSARQRARPRRRPSRRLRAEASGVRGARRGRGRSRPPRPPGAPEGLHGLTRRAERRTGSRARTNQRRARTRTPRACADTPR